MKQLKPVLCLIAAILLYTTGFSQTWVDMMREPNTNFYTLQQEFNQHWANRPLEKGKGYKQFKRYEWFAAPRVYPSGDRTLASRSKAYEQFQQYLNITGPSPLSMPSTWTP